MDFKHYSMLIEWSKDNQVYLVTLPEWAERFIMPITHGNTYSEAAQNGQDVLQILVETARREGKPLPEPGAHSMGSNEPKL